MVVDMEKASYYVGNFPPSLFLVFNNIFVGETIEVKVNVVNESSKDVTQVKVKLMRKVSLLLFFCICLLLLVDVLESQLRRV